MMNKREKTALVVVDYQRDFVDGALGFSGAERLEPGIAARIEEELASGGDLIFTLDTHTDAYMRTHEGKNLPVPHCIRGTDGHRLTDGLLGYADRAVRIFEKSAFGSPELGAFLAAQEYDRVELCGLVSNICVLSNAVIARSALPEAEIVVDSALTASHDPAVHEAALTVLRGIQIVVK